MRESHIPDLDEIIALSDQEIRFFAMIGASMSLAANLELAYFDVFEKGTQLDRTVAARIFYMVMNASTRRQMADAAICGRLTDPTLLAAWKAILIRIEAATGSNSHRNLLGHGTVSKGVTVYLQGIAVHLGTGEQTLLGDPPRVENRYFVPQDPMVVVGANRKPQEADFETLMTFCRDLISILADLRKFLDGL